MRLSVLIAVAILAIVEPQSTHQRVHDFAGLLTQSNRQSLEQLTHEVEQKTTAQVAVVTVHSLDGLTVDAYAHKLFNKWGIGQRETDNGVLFLIAPNERRMRIEVGYGLERLLPDSLCAAIRDSAILPRFKQQDFCGRHHGRDQGDNDSFDFQFQGGGGRFQTQVCRLVDRATTNSYHN